MVSNPIYQTVGQYRELRHRRKCHGMAYSGLHDDEKIADLSQTVLVWSNNEALYIYIYIYIYTYIYIYIYGHVLRRMQ